jgi:hypothetical protein
MDRLGWSPRAGFRLLSATIENLMIVPAKAERAEVLLRQGEYLSPGWLLLLIVTGYACGSDHQI